jgi:hypothetical protein
VAKALGQRGNEQTIAKLSPLLADQRHAVRYMAAASMLKLSLKKNPGNAGNLEIRGHDGQASGPLQP